MEKIKGNNSPDLSSMRKNEFEATLEKVRYKDLDTEKLRAQVISPAHMEEIIDFYAKNTEHLSDNKYEQVDEEDVQEVAILKQLESPPNSLFLGK